jgi:phosphate starvation-inducible protein PhoH
MEKPKKVKENVQVRLNLDLNSEQRSAKGEILNNKITYLTGKSGSGKAQPLDSIVYTPNGPLKMGELKIGDEVLGLNKPTKVIGIYPQGVEDVYEITMSDRTKTRCSLEHLWQVQNKDKAVNNDWKIFTTKELIENMNNNVYFRIPNQGVIEFNKKEVKLNPYLLGILIAEGHLRENLISFSTSDSFILNKIQDILKTTDSKVNYRSNYDYSIIKKQRDNKKNEINIILGELGLISKTSYDKFIPDIYKYNSVEIRKELLKGLIDGDGYVSKKGELEYNTSSFQLAEDVAEVVRSLGGRVTIRSKYPSYTYKGEKLVSNHLHYTLSIVIHNSEELVSLPRKKQRILNFRKNVKYTNRYIQNIKKIDTVETQCIKVDSEDSLYLTDNFIVTHNTLLACEIALNMLFKKQINKIVIARPAVEAGEKIGYLKGSAHEKLDPYLQAMYQNFYNLYKKEAIENYVEEGKIEIIPFAFMRGRTMSRSFVIIDEVQNCTVMQTKMALERLGQGSKMVLCGDLDQVDIPSSKSGVKFLDYLNKKEVVGFNKIVLKTNHRDEMVEDILNVYNEFKEENGIH